MGKTINIDGIEYIEKSTIQDQSEAGFVLIRSYASGVHFGIIERQRDTLQGLEVVLKNARRIHYWEGAASLSQVAMEGISGKNSRVAMMLPSITVQNVIETIPLSADGFHNLSNQPVWKS